MVVRLGLESVVRMRSSWRSWFWNLFSLLIFLMMTFLVVATLVSTVQSGEWWLATVGVGLVAAWVAVAAARSLFVGVFARPRGIVMRGLWLTTTIPWSEVIQITSGPLTSGAAGAFGATTVIVLRNRPGAAEPKSVDLKVLGGYGLSPARPTPADRAIADLNGHLANWRDHRSVRS